MQWCFNINNKEPVFVTVPDNTYPPDIGEEINVTGRKPGFFKVMHRAFEAGFPEEHDGKLSFGWVFELSDREI